VSEVGPLLGPDGCGCVLGVADAAVEPVVIVAVPDSDGGTLFGTDVAGRLEDGDFVGSTVQDAADEELEVAPPEEGGPVPSDDDGSLVILLLAEPSSLLSCSNAPSLAPSATTLSLALATFTASVGWALSIGVTAFRPSALSVTSFSAIEPGLDCDPSAVTATAVSPSLLLSGLLLLSTPEVRGLVVDEGSSTLAGNDVTSTSTAFMSISSL